MPFQVGTLSFDNPVFPAPMTGVTDLPFRKTLRRFSKGLVFSEMIASRCMIDEMRGSQKSRQTYLDEFPIATQLAGCEPDVIAEAARMNADRGATIIDLNFGCPVKKIVNKFGGSALMRDEKLAKNIMEEVVTAVDIPVTLKMRLGWDENSINAPTLAKMAENCGIKMITVHGRTRSQMYNGKANWSAVRAVREATSLPLIINGDIETENQVQEALAQSGADGVMVGRGACGRPWLVSRLQHFLTNKKMQETPSSKTILETLLFHYEELLLFYGAEHGNAIARKHIGWYLKDNPDQESVINLRSKINTSNTPALVQRLLIDYFKSHHEAYHSVL